MIYLDYASATPVDARVLKEMESFWSANFGNPSSAHPAGKNAKEALEQARARAAELLHAKAEEIIFTSGGTEGINLAILGTARAKKQGVMNSYGASNRLRPSETNLHIITSAAEHESVLEACRQLEQEGFSITYLPVDENGMIQPAVLEQAFRPTTILVSLMYANNEVGTINPIKGLAAAAHRHGAWFHTDACQAGLLDLNVHELGVDVLSLNASKIYGPKGAGLLYVRQDTPLRPLLVGGGQERGFRSGTENVPAILGFAKAVELIQGERTEENQRLKKLRDIAISGILKIPFSRLNGHPTACLPGTINVSFRDVEARFLVEELGKQGICAAAGSACTSKSLEPSLVLTAMGIPASYAHGTLRLTIGRQTTEQDIRQLLRVLPTAISKLRASSRRAL
ncbi:cysteine desulfurase [Candidatus Woesearchaeota archaeon]|nr:cysteine desulfurase [Candidatus Woesearchaeota archaeon]